MVDHTLANEMCVVGLRKGLPWLGAELLQDLWFSGLLETVRHAGSVLSVRDVLYALLAHAEYVIARHCPTCDSVSLRHYNTWKTLVQRFEHEVVENVARHGIQANVPQRAALLLDYLGRVLPDVAVSVVELGCSAGLLGRACLHAHLVFSEPGMVRYFWLARSPQYERVCVEKYVGVDRVIPPCDLVPYFVLNEAMRWKLERFMHEIPVAGALHQVTIESFLESVHVECIGKTVVCITSFTLHHFVDPRSLIEQLLALTRQHAHVHWLDLSRAEVWKSGSSENAALLSNRVYLHHNGVPVAYVIGGSNDCPNWEYL